MKKSVPVPARPGMVVEVPAVDFVGAVVRLEMGIVVLEDRNGRRRSFPLGGGFLLEGRPVVLEAPARAAAPRATHTASGSRAAPATRAVVARASRIYVEGRHDAELVEKVWGDDLRYVGVVVEYLEGVDRLADIVAEFRPRPGHRLGVLVDHLVPGSKESRIAAAVSAGPGGGDVLITGHRFVDIWQAVKPDRLGLRRWPDIPRDTEWKVGACRALGWPADDQADIARAWRRILGRVENWNHLERDLLTAVERLIDFVTEDVSGSE
ncbi:DUF3097 family protein [Propionicicella superfundia]|uniref:DUF3097 family protein n=1 Tax=Propionicicella superfundia TaxID=348582 RepID=UPI000687657F